MPTDGTAGQAVVELAPGATAPSRTALKRLLHDHGIGGVAGLVEVATEVARAEGIESPRVTVGGSCVIVALIDTGDIALGAAAELWRRGIDPLTLLVLVDGATWLPHRAVPVVVPDVREATFVLVGARDARERPGLLAVPGGADGLPRVLADQLRRRRAAGPPRAGRTAGLDRGGRDEGRPGDAGPGRPVRPGRRSRRVRRSAARRRPWLTRDGPWPRRSTTATGPTTHLLAGPVVFPLGPSRRAAPVSRLLDLRSGLVHERSGSGSSAVTSVRFLALDRPTTAAVRADVPAGHRTGPPVRAPHGADSVETGLLAATRWIRVAGTTRGHRRRRRADPCRATRRERRRAPTRAVVDRVVAIRSGTDAPPSPDVVVAAAAEESGVGIDRLLATHRRAWADRWEHADVTIEGDEKLQSAVRFALFHLMGSVADTGEAAVGPRGLTGSGYSGHVFWDADAFVLPFLAATHPASARAMLEYRLRRLPAAVATARALGPRRHALPVGVGPHGRGRDPAECP